MCPGRHAVADDITEPPRDIQSGLSRVPGEEERVDGVPAGDVVPTTDSRAVARPQSATCHCNLNSTEGEEQRETLTLGQY